MQLHSFCFLFLSFSLCSAKIVSVTHLYPARKVTCGQCCKTPGGSCGCCTEMTYVKVTKYTQKLWRRKVWFQRKLSHASWDKWETRLFAPLESFHGTGLLVVSPGSPYMRWRTPCLCLALLCRYRYCSVPGCKQGLRLGLVVAQERAHGTTELSGGFPCSQSLAWLWASPLPLPVIQKPLSSHL